MDSIRHFQSGSAWITWLQRAVLILMALVLFIPAAPVQADIGPKPTETFTFEFKIPRVDIVSGQLFECAVSDCQDARQLVNEPMQHFTCQADLCSARTSRTFEKYQKLVITFSDGVRVSNIFTVNPLDSSFTVTVLQDSLKVSLAPELSQPRLLPQPGPDPGAGNPAGKPLPVRLPPAQVVIRLGANRQPDHPALCLGRVPLPGVEQLAVHRFIRNLCRRRRGHLYLSRHQPRHLAAPRHRSQPGDERLQLPGWSGHRFLIH